MNDISSSIFFYSANFVFILTNLYGWILKSFYRPKLYKDNYDNLFPSQKANAALYLLQVFEIPYLLMIGEPKALFYVNAFSILLFSSLMVVMCDNYFFLKRRGGIRSILYFAPAGVLIVYLLLAAVEIIPVMENTYPLMFWVVCLVFFYYVAQLIGVQYHIHQSIRQVNERMYSNSDDFPVRYARRIEWIPISICLLMFLCFVLNDVHVKMWRDLFFTFVNVAFLLYTLNPHRKGIKREGKREYELEQILTDSKNRSKYKLSEERCKELEQELFALIKQEKLFLDCHISVDQIAKRLNTNKNYISEIAVRSEYGSFYALINRFRLEYAEQMLRQDPSLKIEHVALDSGFSSGSVFAQVFKRYRGIPPKAFVKELLLVPYTQTKDV